MMNILEVIKYCKDSKGVTIPGLQVKYGLTYKETKSIVDKLITEGELAYDGGIKYNYVGNFGELHEIDFDEAKDAARSNEERRLYFETHRREVDHRLRDLILKNEANRDEDDDEDDDIGDDEDEAYEKLLESLREEDEEDDEDDDIADNLTNMRKRLENLNKHYNIKQIFNNCINSRIKTENDGDESRNALTLPDGEQFNVEYEDGIMQLSYDGFAPADCRSVMRANLIIKEYKSLAYKADKIVATAENVADTLTVFLELYAAVVRIKHGD